MTIGDLLDPGAVALRAGAPGKRQALSLVADVAARVLGVDANATLEGLLEREAAGSTGVSTFCSNEQNTVRKDPAGGAAAANSAGCTTPFNPL